MRSLLWSSFMNPNTQRLESTGRTLCHYINGAATGTQVITHEPIYLQRDTMTTRVRLAGGMSLYDILTMGPIGKRYWVKKSISWCNIDFKNLNVKIKKSKIKQLFGIDRNEHWFQIKRISHWQEELDTVEKTLREKKGWAHFTDSYLPVVNATDASVQVRQVWQKGSDWI